MIHRAALILSLLVSVGVAATHPEAGNVLILVNDAVAPEPGTGAKGASVFIGEYYAQQRGVPMNQILHLNLPMAGGGAGTPQDWDSWHTNWAKLQSGILEPIRKFLAGNQLTGKINYIVPVYGVPIATLDATGTVGGLSIDSFIAGLNSSQTSQFLPNPYLAPWNEGKAHFRNFQNPAGWKMYIVTRLDGPTWQVAKGLVDKAIHAEENLKSTDGIAYFDYRHIAPGTSGYYIADQTVANAYNLAKSLGFQTVFNDNQSNLDKMIRSAPKTLWAWGWYSGPYTWDGYEFVEGAVGAQLTSYTAGNIRAMWNDSWPWVPLWLKAGITATWGATTEPYTQGYANGDNLFHKFWSGYNFGESAYMATPYLNHAMIFVGDPLYAPKVFQPGKLALKSPAILNAADWTPAISPGSIATIVGSNLSNCTAQNHALALPLSLCGTTVKLNGQPAPLFYVSPTQINLLAPRGLTPGQDTTIVVTREDGDTATETLAANRFTASAPGIFQWQPDGVTRAIVQNSDYSTNGPTGAGARALKLGEAAMVYASGLGPIDTPLSDTSPAPAKTLIRTLANVQVFVNGKAQYTPFSGLTPLQFGLYQVNFVLDPATPVLDNDQNVIWLKVDGYSTAQLRISLAR